MHGQTYIYCVFINSKLVSGTLYIRDGGRVGRNRGLKRFFTLNSPSCHIEAYIRPEKYCFVWAGPLANHHSVLTSFFLATAERQRRKERYVLQIYTAASRQYTVATDGRRAAKLAWGIAWPFGCPTLPVEKSSEFKFGNIAANPPKTRIFATAAN